MFASSVHPAPSLCPDSSILDWSRRRSSQLSQHRQVMQTQRQVMQGHSREVDISHFIMELSNILNLIMVSNSFSSTDTSSPAVRIQTPSPAPRHCLSAGMPWWRSWALTSEQTAPVLAPRETSGSCSSVSSISDSSGPIPA